VKITNQERKEALLWGSFIADALSLGAHWVYDTNVIKNEIKDLRNYHNPISKYHPTKKAGDFTHYGDMSLFLLSFIKDYDFSKSTLEKDISNQWSEFISSYNGYLDHGTKESIKNYKNDMIPSGQINISDLSPSSRIAPFIYKFIDKSSKLKEYVLIQTKMTHNTALSISSTILMIDIIQDIFNDLTPSEAIQNRLKDDTIKELHPYIEVAIKSVDSQKDDMKAIKEFGASCIIDDALASSLFFILKYENDFEKALISNIACGGDNSSRSMFIGLVLASYLGKNAISSDLINGLNYKDDILKFI